MTQMTYDEWEDFDEGKAIALATEIWSLRTSANDAYTYMIGLGKRSPEDKNLYEEWEAACVEAKDIYSQSTSDYLEKNGQFRERYGWDLDDLDILDDCDDNSDD